MNILIKNLPDLPDEWEYTGEWRCANNGEFYLGFVNGKWIPILRADKNGGDCYPTWNTVFILRLKRWKANYNEQYFSITSYGEIILIIDQYTDINNNHYNSGNYFQTEELAKNSNIYKAFHPEIYKGMN